MEPSFHGCDNGKDQGGFRMGVGSECVVANDMFSLSRIKVLLPRLAPLRPG